SRPPHADVVETGDQNGGPDRHQLTVVNGKNMVAGQRQSENGLPQGFHMRKVPEHAYQSATYSGDRGRLRDGEPGPGVEERGQRPVTVAHVDIFAAGKRP